MVKINNQSTLEDFKRIRPAEFMRLLSIRYSKFYRGLESGEIPKPDGYDGCGNRSYWYAKTVLQHLSNPKKLSGK